MKKERKFRFIRDLKFYTWKINPVKWRIYTLDEINSMRGFGTETTYDTVKYWCNNHFGWQEVIEEEPETIESLTAKLKELANSQGMNCDVVIEEKKKVEVNFTRISGKYDRLRFHFDFSKVVDPSVFGDKMAAYLQELLNEN